MTEQHEFWPDGARLAVSVSVQFEAGGQPISGASGPITEPILDGFPDLGQNTFYEYGAREGVPRILDLLLRARLPGPRPRPDLHPAAQPRRVVGPQGPDRPVGPRPSRYRRLGGPGPGTGQLPAGTERLRPAA